MKEFVLVNDVHLSDRSPSSRNPGYLDEIFELLDQIATLAQSRDAAIVLAGDVFHHKTPARTSHATVMRLIDWARAALVPVYAVLGNHDVLNDRVQSIHETQPLGVVMASGAIHLLDGWMNDQDGSPVYGVPWQMSFDDTNVTEALLSWRSEGVDEHKLVVTHAPLYPPGQELQYEFYPATAWAKAMGNTATVHYGHVHEPHGIYAVDGVTFSNCGALSRGSLHEHNLTRTPSVAIWDADTGQIRHHTLNARPAVEIFKLVEAHAAKQAGLDLSTFLDSLKATQIAVTDLNSVLEHVRATQEDHALVGVITKLLQEVQ